MSPMMMMISIGKARQNNHFCHEQRHEQNSTRQRGQDRVVGSLSLLGGLCNIVSLEAEEMVCGKRRLLDKFFVFCLLADGRRGEERRGKGRKGEERKGKQASGKICILGVQLTRGTTTSYYFLGTIVLTTVAINQLVNQSTHLSIYPSVYLSVYCTCTKSACLLACLLTGWLLLLRDLIILFLIMSCCIVAFTTTLPTREL